MLLGLSIDGKIVNGRVNQDNSIYEELLGAPLCEDTTTRQTSSQPRCQGIYLKDLKTILFKYTLSEESTEYEKIIKAWCYIMILFGKFYFLKVSVIW